MKFSLNSKTPLAFGVAMSILLLIVALCYRWTVLSDESDLWVKHTQVVTVAVSDLKQAVESIQSNSHDFAFTGNRVYIESYHVSATEAEQNLKMLRHLTADNPAQQRRITVLVGLEAESTREAETVINLRRAEGRAAAEAYIGAGWDQPAIDESRALLGDMRDEERRLRVLRVGRSDYYLGQTKRLLGVGVILGILVAGFAVWTALRQRSARTKSQVELLDKVEELSRSNEELAQITEEAQTMARQMTYSAGHDTLTGLPNRLLLNDRIGRAIALATRYDRKVAVLFLDLDGFKHINDSLGHPAGDTLLQLIASRLLSCVRATDTVSRLGGDEFVILLSEIDHPKDTITISNNFLQAVAEASDIDQHDLHVTASIGISTYPDDGRDAETLIKNADTAMFQAKENGRHSYQFFKPEMNVRAVERQLIEEYLRRALERREFRLHYQPKINLRTGAITGVEALIRWEHPVQGAVPPGQFIPVAEECGLILPIGAWALQEACAQAKAWADAGLPAITISVNVSPLQLRDKSFLDVLCAVLGETGLDPKSLELEVTEGAIMKRPEVTGPILSTLRGMGVRVAIDDFGTGYSSLSYLLTLPLDALKIDQSFVRRITTSSDGTTIVRTIISMGQSLNLRIIAEGVETQEELDFLKVQDCDEAQGYYFSRPVPPQQIATLLKADFQGESGRRQGDGPSPHGSSSTGASLLRSESMARGAIPVKVVHEIHLRDADLQHEERE